MAVNKINYLNYNLHNHCLYCEDYKEVGYNGCCYFDDINCYHHGY